MRVYKGLIPKSTLCGYTTGSVGTLIAVHFVWLHYWLSGHPDSRECHDYNL